MLIRKPNEIDPDYRCDGSGHYRLAIQDAVDRLADEQKDQAWPWAQTPLGGYRPLPAARKFHRSRKRFRHALGGNRSSKSHSLAVETMWRAMGMHPFRSDLQTPAVGWYATTTFEKVADTLWEKLDPVKGGLLQGIEALNFRWDVVWRSKQHGIPNKLLLHLPPDHRRASEVIFKAYEQGRESFQAVALDFAHFDEQYSRIIFTETVSRIGAGKAMEFADAFTPLIPDQWLQDRTALHVPETDDVFYFPLDDNRQGYGGFIDDALIDGTIAEWPPEVRDTRRLGRWGAFLGAAFQTFDRAAHVVSPERERRLFLKGSNDRLPYDVPVVGSIDWGGNNPFVFLWICRIPWLDDDYYVLDEYFWDFARGPRMLKDHAAEIRARTAKWGGPLVRTWADHDPTDAREFAGMGVPSQPANKQNKLAGVETLQTLFNPRQHLANADWPKGRPRLHIAERCTNLIRELPLIRWKEATDRQDAPRELVKKDDHATDALRYAIESERNYERKAGPVAVPAGRFKRQF